MIDSGNVFRPGDPELAALSAEFIRLSVTRPASLVQPSHLLSLLRDVDVPFHRALISLVNYPGSFKPPASGSRRDPPSIVDKTCAGARRSHGIAIKSGHPTNSPRCKLSETVRRLRREFRSADHAIMARRFLPSRPSPRNFNDGKGSRLTAAVCVAGDLPSVPVRVAAGPGN